MRTHFQIHALRVRHLTSAALCDRTLKYSLKPFWISGWTISSSCCPPLSTSVQVARLRYCTWALASSSLSVSDLDLIQAGMDTWAASVIGRPSRLWPHRTSGSGTAYSLRQADVALGMNLW